MKNAADHRLFKFTRWIHNFIPSKVLYSKKIYIMNNYILLHKSNYDEKLFFIPKLRKLSFINRDVYSIPTVLPKLYGKKVITFDLSYNNIAQLNNLEDFPILEELILDNNNLDDSLIFPCIPTLKILSLNNNNITDIEALLKKIKSRLPNLQYLSLLGNIACPNQLSDLDKDDEDYQRYRNPFFYVDERCCLADGYPFHKGSYIITKWELPFVQGTLMSKMVDQDMNLLGCGID